MKKFLILFSTILTLICTPNVLAKDFRFVQVDGALYSNNNEVSQKRLKDIVQDINKQKNVEFVVFSGNNISKPSKENLLGFIDITKKLNTPYYVVLGNKDINKQKDLGKLEYTKILSKRVKSHKKITSPNYVFEKNKNIFIVVDGSKEFISNSMGYYRDDVLEWLDKELTLNANKKVYIIQHFPIIAPAQKESRYTHKADKYINLLSKHKNVKAVIAGHFGVNKEEKVDGILHISTSEAPNYRIIDILNYETENPIIWSTIKP